MPNFDKAGALVRNGRLYSFGVNLARLIKYKDTTVEHALDEHSDEIAEQGTIKNYPKSNVIPASGVLDGTDQIMICNHLCRFRLGINGISINGSAATVVSNMPKANKNQTILCRFQGGSQTYLHQMQITTDGILRNLYPLVTSWNNLNIAIEGEYFTVL